MFQARAVDPTQEGEEASSREVRKRLRKIEKIKKASKKDEALRDAWCNHHREKIAQKAQQLSSDDAIALLQDREKLTIEQLQQFMAFIQTQDHASVWHPEPEDKPLMRLALQDLYCKSQDPVVNEIVKQKLNLLFGKFEKLPEDVLVKDLQESLSEWNEHIERTEGKEIAFLGFLEPVGVPLAAYASVKHEGNNSRVTIMRRCLSNLADEHKLLHSTMTGLTGEGASDALKAQAIPVLIDKLLAHYSTPGHAHLGGEQASRNEAVNDVLASELGIKKARDTRDRLMFWGNIMAAIKILNFPLFVAGAVLTFIPVAQIIGIALMVSSLAVGFTAACCQWFTGKKLLPRTDYAAHLSDKFLEKSCQDLGKSLQPNGPAHGRQRGAQPAHGPAPVHWVDPNAFAYGAAHHAHPHAANLGHGHGPWRPLPGALQASGHAQWVNAHEYVPPCTWFVPGSPVQYQGAAHISPYIGPVNGYQHGPQHASFGAVHGPVAGGGQWVDQAQFVPGPPAPRQVPHQNGVHVINLGHAQHGHPQQGPLRAAQMPVAGGGQWVDQAQYVSRPPVPRQVPRHAPPQSRVHVTRPHVVPQRPRPQPQRSRPSVQGNGAVAVHAGWSR